MNMQHESSVTHQKHIDSGMTVEWTRTSAQDSPDSEWDVVCYTNGQRWLFDNGSARQLTLLGVVRDGLNTAEILEDDCGVIVALYAGGIQAFDDRESWVESLPKSDREEAGAVIANA